MANEIGGAYTEISQVQLFPWNRHDLTSLVDEKGKYLGMDDLEIALQTADAHIARFAAQTSPTFPVEFDDPDDEEDDDEEDGMDAITRANAEDGEQPE